MTNTKGQYKGEFGEVTPSDAVNHDPEKKFPPVPEKDRHEARAREIAEELYQVSPDVKCFRWEGCAIQHHEATDFMPMAHTIVNHIAEEVRLALNSSWSKAEKDAYLLLRGLIPSPDQPEVTGA